MTKVRLQPIGRLLLSVVATAFLICAENAVATAQEKNQPRTNKNDKLRSFTVADSIAMGHFEVPNELYIGDAPISPDGKKFFVVVERGILNKNLREYSLMVYGMASAGKPMFTTKFDTSSNRPGISQAEWLNDRSISLIGEFPNALPQVYILDIISRTQRKLTADNLGVRSYALSKTGTKLLYYGLKENIGPDIKYKEDHGFAVRDEFLSRLVTGAWRQPQSLTSLHIQDLVSGKVRVLLPQPIIRGTPPIWLSPDGRYAVIEQPAKRVPAEWASYDDPFIKRYAQDWLAHQIKPDFVFETALVETKTGKIQSLIGAPSSVGMISSAVWSRDSQSAVVAGTLLPLNIDDKAELAKRQAHTFVASVRVGNGSIDKIVEIQKDEWLSVQPGSLPDTLEVIGSKKENGGLVGTLPVRNFQYRAGKWIENLSRRLGNQLSQITIRQSLDHWPVLVKVDPSKKETLILDPNPYFNKFRFGRREVIHWTDRLGQSLTAGLVYPTQYIPGRKYPLVIQTHGFSPEQFLLDGPFTTAMAAQELANKGIVVLQLPQSPLEIADTCKRGEPTQSQIESAVDYLDRKGLIDRSRVGLVGFSVTGFNVRHALVNSKYHFAAATSAEGNDWGYWSYIAESDLGAWTSQGECPYGGPPWGNHQDRWFKDSISFHYDKIHTPLRLESESNDDNWAGVLNEWENFIALKRLHKPVELIYLPHGTHMLVKPWDRMTSQQGEVDWMVFWLKGEEDPDPSKAEQYVRWRELQRLQRVDNEKLSDGNPSN